MYVIQTLVLTIDMIRTIYLPFVAKGMDVSEQIHSVAGNYVCSVTTQPITCHIERDTNGQLG